MMNRASGLGRSFLQKGPPGKEVGRYFLSRRERYVLGLGLARKAYHPRPRASASHSRRLRSS